MAAMFVVSGGAHAQPEDDWVPFTADGQSQVNVARITQGPQEFLRAWVRVAFPMPLLRNGAGGMLGHWEFDCSTLRYRILEVSYIQDLDSMSPIPWSGPREPGKWIYDRPGSNGYELLTRVCRGAQAVSPR